MPDKTIDYYNLNAATFSADTMDVDFHNVQEQVAREFYVSTGTIMNVISMYNKPIV